jgi:glycosyltransferase involved in cell wall biosynthesis
MPAPSDPAAIAEAGLLPRFGRRRFALTVGTFEIRKNHRLLIDLWHELVADPGFDLDLVIVGMPGWRVDDVIARLEASPLFGTRIFWLRRLPDAALSWLYDNCHVMLFPSFYEGWGLPVVEALQHGRPVIASNRGATPEAGLGAALLLDPEDPAAWGAAIRMAAATPRQSITVARIPDWDTTAREMKSILAALTNRRPATAEAA